MPTPRNIIKEGIPNLSEIPKELKKYDLMVTVKNEKIFF